MLSFRPVVRSEREPQSRTLKAGVNVVCPRFHLISIDCLREPGIELLDQAACPVRLPDGLVVSIKICQSHDIATYACDFIRVRALELTSENTVIPATCR